MHISWQWQKAAFLWYQNKMNCKLYVPSWHKAWRFGCFPIPTRYRNLINLYIPSMSAKQTGQTEFCRTRPKNNTREFCDNKPTCILSVKSIVPSPQWLERKGDMKSKKKKKQRLNLDWQTLCRHFNLESFPFLIFLIVNE